MRFQTKRVYLPAEKSDGRRILIDRLWPRGLSKASAAIDYWAKDVAPSNGLRKWYQHDPAKWDEFRKLYFAELDAQPDGVEALRGELASGTNTIVFASKEEDLNNATALVAYLERREKAPAGRRR